MVSSPKPTLCRIVIVALILFPIVFTRNHIIRAQEDASALYGVWHNPIETVCPEYLFFLPDGVWGHEFNCEGLRYGTYRIIGGRIQVSARLYYIEDSPLNLDFGYHLSGNTLSFDEHNTIYFKVRSFSHFGMMPCVEPGYTHLFVGAAGRVTFGSNTSSRLRSAPSISSDVLDLLPEGTRFFVVGGPTCADDHTWWLVDVNGNFGWVAEGLHDNRYLEFLGFISEPYFVFDPPSDPEQFLEEITEDTDSTLYIPNTYPYLDQIAAWLGQDISSGDFDSTDILQSIRDAYIIIREGPGLDSILCLYVSAQDINDVETGGDTLCFLIEVSNAGLLALKGNPYVLPITIAIEVLSDPDKYIDWWLMPLNNFIDTRPLTRGFCWITRMDCSLIR